MGSISREWLFALTISLSLLLVNLLVTPGVTGGGNGNDLPVPQSDILLDWDHYEGEFRYIYTEGGNLDPDTVTMDIREKNSGYRETLMTGDGSLYKEGSRIIGNSSLEPRDDQEYAITVRINGEPVADREFSTSGEEFVPTAGLYTYDMHMEMAENDDDFSLSMLMDMTATIENTEQYEETTMEGTLEMHSNDEGINIDMSGTADQMDKEASGIPIDSYMNMDLEGTFDYNDGLMSMSGDTRMRLSEENKLDTEQYFLMDGTWSMGTSGGTIYSEEQTVRFENHDNHNGESFDCMVQDSYFLRTDSGDEYENFTTNWNVREDGYTNTTVYFEYEEKENGDTTEEGSKYPENSPEPEDEDLDLSDIAELNGASPIVPVPGDVFVFPSEEDVDFTIRYEVSRAVTKNYAGRSFNALLLTGTAQGEGSGNSKLYISFDPEYEGLTLYFMQDLEWGSQTLMATFTITDVQADPSNEDDDELNLLLLLIPLVVILAIVGGAVAYRRRDLGDDAGDELWDQPLQTPVTGQQQTIATPGTAQPGYTQGQVAYQTQAGQVAYQTQGQVAYQGQEQRFDVGQGYATGGVFGTAATATNTVPATATNAPAVVAQAPPAATCPFCSGLAPFLPEYRYYYCANCQQYLELY